MNKDIKERDILLGNRIPKHFFETSGKGESDLSVHSGSYHLALKDANIEKYNIVTYSSILPGIARKINQPTNPDHGAVLETIMAVCHSENGKRATAGIIYGWLFDKVSKKKHGGLVCELTGEYEIDRLCNLLKASIKELYHRSFAEQYNLKDTIILTESITPEKRYGTALVALCFTSFYCPVLENKAE